MKKQAMIAACVCGMILSLAACKGDDQPSGSSDTGSVEITLPDATASDYSGNIGSAKEVGETYTANDISATLKDITSADASDENGSRALYSFRLEIKNDSDSKQYMAIDAPELYNHSAQPLTRGDSGFSYADNSDVYYSSDFELEAGEAKEFVFSFYGPLDYGEAYIGFRIYGDGTTSGTAGMMHYPTFAEPFYRVALNV